MHFIVLILPTWQCLKNCDIICWLQGVWWGEQSSRALVSPLRVAGSLGRWVGRGPCTSVSACPLALVPHAGLSAAAQGRHRSAQRQVQVSSCCGCHPVMLALRV